MVRRLCHFTESENLAGTEADWLDRFNKRFYGSAASLQPQTDQWPRSSQAPIVPPGHPASQDVHSTRRLLTKPRQPGRGRARARGR